MSFPDQLEQIRSQFSSDLSSICSTQELESLRITYFGKKGLFTSFMLLLREAPEKERPRLGKLINDVKQTLLVHLENTRLRLVAEELHSQLVAEQLDETLPGKRSFLGVEHPVQKLLNRAVDIFSSLGFSVALGPDLDTDYYNFEGLNFAEDHPARDMQDTFYFPGGYLLRTHTSNVQVHFMQDHTPPIRVIAPGKCFRNETVSGRSHVFFHQIEGFYIDKQANFASLFSIMRAFCRQLFSSDIKVRFRPSYFPFVEPGIEVDIACLQCQSKGCKLCKETGWLEVAGAGMIHPNVLSKSKIDPEKYTGYAWGIGVERLAMLIYGIDDIRIFSENNARLFEQVAFNS